MWFRPDIVLRRAKFLLEISFSQYGQPIGTSLGIAAGKWISHENMSNDVPVVRDLPEDLYTPAPDYFPVEERGTFMGFRRSDGRVGTRNFVLIVPTSMCASHEASQISMMSEFLHYKREKFPNVDGVVAIPHNKGCGCQDGSNLGNYAARAGKLRRSSERRRRDFN